MTRRNKREGGSAADTEYRSAELTALQEGEQGIAGYASVFNAPTLLYTFDGVEYWETVDTGAFAGADLSNVVLRYNHSDHFSVLARTSNDTLRLHVDETGLHIEADIAKTSQGKDVYELIRRKDVTKMSYGYIVAKDYIEKKSEDKYLRHVSKIKKVVDVSVVDFPAYDETNVDLVMRSFARMEKDALEMCRKHLFLKGKM